MMNQRYGLLVTILAAGLVAGCGQGGAKNTAKDAGKEAAPVQSDHSKMPKDDVHGMLSNMPKDDVHAKAMAESGEGMHGSIGVNTELHLDPAITAAWTGVTLRVTDRNDGSERDVTVPLGKTTPLSDTDLVVTADTFVPDFVMGADGIGSRSAEPNNPAVHVTIEEAGKTVFDGWLFQKMPDIHPFAHQRYAVVLAGGIPSKGAR